MTAIIWFRRDLRTEDHKALQRAIACEQPLLAIFHINPQQLSSTQTANQTAFFQSVQNFKKHLAQAGITLHLLFGDLETCFHQLLTQVPDWTAVYFNYDEAGYGRGRDQQAAAFFRAHGITIHAYQDHYLHGSQDIKNKLGQPYQVFTPYYRTWFEHPKETPIPVDLSLGKWQSLPSDPSVLQLLEKLADGPQLHTPGTTAAHQRLQTFLQEGLASYDTQRDYPTKTGTSQLSPYLRSGEISIRTVFHAVSQAPSSTGQATFIKELAWRDFYNMIHVLFPAQKEQAIQPAFKQLPWGNDKALFTAWATGQTGYPIVDAAMKQLLETGWMHNRLRMIVASFLTKDLLIDWRWGEQYFQDQLIDYDAASNIGGWQWAASLGTDAVPYFRIFNPTTQGKKIDPDGQFIKTYLPQLRHVPKKYLHEPWKMSRDLQVGTGCQIGQDYPAPIVDHQQQRRKALALYQETKEHYQHAKSDSTKDH